MRKNGFTLLELLSVIIVLGLIALITVPVVLKLINNSKKNSAIISAREYVSQLKTTILDNSKKTGLKNITCMVNEEDPKTVICNGESFEINVEGNIPKCGTIQFENYKLKSYLINISGYGIKKLSESDDEEAKKIPECDWEWVEETEKLPRFNNSDVNNQNNDYEEEDDDSEDDNNYILTQKSPGLYDENLNLIASWSALVNNYRIDVSMNQTGSIVLYKPPYTMLFSHEKLKKGRILIISPTVTKIGKYAFNGCDTLTTIVIPKSVTTIDEGAFVFSKTITKVIFENNSKLKTIETGAFNNCEKLNSITLPNGLTNIGDFAFSGTSLKKVTIPSTVTHIGQYAFYDDPLISVTFKNTTGWKYYIPSSWTNSVETNIDVTNRSLNAKNLTYNYSNYNWKRS